MDRITKFIHVKVFDFYNVKYIFITAHKYS